MDWTNLIGNSPFAGLLPAAGDPASAAASAPMNILPPTAQTSPTVVAGQPGILNQQGGSAALSEALKMIQQPTPQVPVQPQIQMAKPVGSAAGFDPSRILAAIRGASPAST